MEGEKNPFALSDALAKARVLRGITQEDAAEHAGIRLAELREIETRLAHPSPAIIADLAEIYGLDTERLGTDKWVPRSEPRLDAENHTIWIEWLPIAYGPEQRSNIEILEAVADGIRLLRSYAPLTPVHMRTHELDLVVSILDLDDGQLVRDLIRAFRIPWKEAEALMPATKNRVRTASILERVRGLSTADSV